MNVETAEAVKLHDDLLASRPDGARHDSDICPICVDKASQTGPTASDPSRSGGADVSDSSTSQTNTQEGGTTPKMSDPTMISEETHQALLAKAVADATSATDKALEAKATEATELAGKVETLTTERDTLKADNDRLNKELDTAQVELKAKTDEVAELQKTTEEAAAAAEKQTVASQRADEVKALGLFGDEYVTEKASAWAELSNEDWASRLDEWKQLKPAAAAPKDDKAKKATDTAMSGTSEDLTKGGDTAADDKVSTRRAALGLVS